MKCLQKYFFAVILFVIDFIFKVMSRNYRKIANYFQNSQKATNLSTANVMNESGNATKFVYISNSQLMAAYCLLYELRSFVQKIRHIIFSPFSIFTPMKPYFATNKIVHLQSGIGYITMM